MAVIGGNHRHSGSFGGQVADEIRVVNVRVEDIDSAVGEDLRNHFRPRDVPAVPCENLRYGNTVSANPFGPLMPSVLLHQGDHLLLFVSFRFDSCLYKDSCSLNCPQHITPFKQ